MRFYRSTYFQKLLYPSFTWKRESDDTIFLTFDDGPTQDTTPWVLDELDKVDANATFFCLGCNLKKNQPIAKEIVARNHALGNHTFNHLNGWKTKSEQFFRDIEACDDQLAKLNVRTRLFRPPYGRVTQKQVRKLDQKETVMWSYLAWDFSGSFKTRKVLNALMNAGPGDIVLFHDSQKASSNLKRILPELLNHYKSQGLKFGIL